MSAPPPDTKNSDDELLELADLIEDEADLSSGGSSDDLDDAGVDTSFEQELEDLFAEDLGLPDDDGSEDDDLAALLEDGNGTEPEPDDDGDGEADDDDILLLDDIVPEPPEDGDMAGGAPGGDDDDDMDLDGLDELIDDMNDVSPADDDDVLSMDDLGAEELDDALGGDDALDADELLADLDGLQGDDDEDDGILLLDEVVEEVEPEPEPEPEPKPQPKPKAGRNVPERTEATPDADELENFLLSGSGGGIEYERDEPAEAVEPAAVADAPADDLDDLGDLDELMAEVDEIELEPALEPELAEPEPGDDLAADLADDSGDDLVDDLDGDLGDDLDALLDEVEEAAAPEPEFEAASPGESAPEDDEDIDDVLDSLTAAHDMDVDALLAQDEGDVDSLGLDDIDALDDALNDMDALESESADLSVEGLDTLEDLRAQILVMEEAASNSRDFLDDLEARVQTLESREEGGDPLEKLLEPGSPVLDRIRDALVDDVLVRVESGLESRMGEKGDGLKEELLATITAELDKLVPAAAARIIREEIAALSEEMDGDQQAFIS